MIVMGLRLILIVLVVGAMNFTVSWAGNSDRVPLSSTRPFQIGEQFTYEISWMNIKAGTAVMGVTAVRTENPPLVKLVTTALWRPAITKFFPVDNRVEGVCLRTGQTVVYRWLPACERPATRLESGMSFLLFSKSQSLHNFLIPQTFEPLL